ncbi:hypothetical protein [Azonexus hydrophilus]|uniref:hypothetical protein n=1 Tax=Azonexus hydrophilus TaxID=418702 RepID=UPI0024907A14|nr:hypothetical protein [Azonexus hydrophilus]
MVVQVEFWHLVTLLLAFFSFVGGVVKFLFVQADKRQMADKAAQAEADAQQRAQQAKTDAQQRAHWDNRFSVLEESAKGWKKIERELLELKAALPLNYVLRDDDIRRQSIIEAKIDGLAKRFEDAIIRGGKHG